MSHFSFRRALGALALCAAMLGAGTGPASARMFVGFGVGVPFYGPGFYPGPYYYPRPYYYPPPVYYPPPPVYYTPPQVYTPAPITGGAEGQACHAGPYVCPMERSVAPGGACFCIGNNGQKAWGRTN